MTPTFLLILVAVIAGIAVAIQGQFMGAIDRRAGTATSVLVTYGVGALGAAIYWMSRGAPAARVREIPWYAWSAGLFGLVIVGGIGYAAPRLGLSRTLIITVAAQLAAAAVIDHVTGARGFDAPRALGLALTIVGAWLVVN